MKLNDEPVSMISINKIYILVNDSNIDNND